MSSVQQSPHTCLILCGPEDKWSISFWIGPLLLKPEFGISSCSSGWYLPRHHLTVCCLSCTLWLCPDSFQNKGNDKSAVCLYSQDPAAQLECTAIKWRHVLLLEPHAWLYNIPKWFMESRHHPSDSLQSAVRMNAAAVYLCVLRGVMRIFYLL